MKNYLTSLLCKPCRSNADVPIEAYQEYIEVLQQLRKKDKIIINKLIKDIKQLKEDKKKDLSTIKSLKQHIEKLEDIESLEESDAISLLGLN